MSVTPQMSIIVPIYNVEMYLQKCIDSILAQTFRDFELILVDDGSPDGCPAICDAAAEKDERVVVVHKKNGGLSSARNAGLEIARGEYIGFIDSDDYIDPEMYETLLRRMQADGSQLAICNYAYVDEAGNILPRKSSITKDEVLTREEVMRRLIGPENWYYITAVNRLYPRKLLEHVRFPEGKFHEDQYTAHLVYWQCPKVSVVKEALYFYFQRSDSIMRQESVKQRLDEANGFLERAAFALEHQVYDVAVGACSGGLGKLAESNVRKQEQTPEERKLLAQTTAYARKLARQCLKVPGDPAEKWKLRLFVISPRLYAWARRFR